MPIHNVMFYSGSILHDKDVDGSERKIRGGHHAAIEARLPAMPEEEPAPLVRGKACSDLVWAGMQRAHAVAAEKWRVASEAWEAAGEEIAQAGVADQLLVTKYNNILKNYTYLDYLRCTHTYLAEFLAADACAYLLHEGTNVLAQGSKSFHLHAGCSSPIRQADSADQVSLKLGKGKVVGAFARTASVVNPNEFGHLGCTGQGRFVKANASSAYDVIPVPGVIPEGWTQVMVGGKATVPNKSSCVLQVDMDAFVGRMLDADLGFPVFSVSDCNSFHTSGYLWATYALRKARSHDDGEPVAILNFDQHGDVGDDGDTVASDRWGKPALGTVTKGIYMSFGNATDGRPGLDQDHKWPNTLICKNGVSVTTLTKEAAKALANKSYLAMDAKEKVVYVGGILASLQGRWASVQGEPDHAALVNVVCASVPQAPNFPHALNPLDLSALFAELWRNLSAYFGAPNASKPFKYVFVTVDRDAVQNHQTQWGDRCFFPNAHGLHGTISAIVDPLFEACPGSRLIGFDITGLPESRAIYDAWSNNVKTTDLAWGEARNEITLMREWARYRVTTGSPFIDRAQVIFSNLASDLRGKTLTGYVPPLAKTEINKFARSLSRFVDKPVVSPVMGMMFAERSTQQLQSIHDALRTASRTQSFIPKQTKTHIQSYANRIANLLELTQA